MTDHNYPGTRVLVARYDGRCAACKGRFFQGDVVAYTPDAPRGRKAAHPKCHGADIDLIVMRAAEEAAKEARERYLLAQGEDMVRAAEAELVAAIKGIYRIMFRLTTDPRTKTLFRYASDMTKLEVIAERRATVSGRSVEEEVRAQEGEAANASNVVQLRRAAT